MTEVLRNEPGCCGMCGGLLSEADRHPHGSRFKLRDDNVVGDENDPDYATEVCSGCWERAGEIAEGRKSASDLDWPLIKGCCAEPPRQAEGFRPCRNKLIRSEGQPEQPLCHPPRVQHRP